MSSSTIARPQAKISRPASARRRYQGHIFSVWQWPQKLYDGQEVLFETISRTDTVTILPITAEKKVLMTRQEQPRIAAFYGLPGGVVDSGEEPLAAAKRELLEETGYQAENWQLWFASQVSSKIDWANYVFVAQACRKVAKQNLDGGEKISVLELSLDEYIEIMRRDDYRDQEIALRYFRMTVIEQAEFRQRYFAA